MLSGNSGRPGCLGSGTSPQNLQTADVCRWTEQICRFSASKSQAVPLEANPGRLCRATGMRSSKAVVSLTSPKPAHRESQRRSAPIAWPDCPFFPLLFLSPDFLPLEGGLLAHQFALVSRLVVGLIARFAHDELLAIERNSTLPLFGCRDQSDGQLCGRQSEVPNRHQKWQAANQAWRRHGSLRHKALRHANQSLWVVAANPHPIRVA